MDAPEKPQLCLVTPPLFDSRDFAATLARVLDGAEIACIRLDMATRDEAELMRAGDTLREIAHARDIAIVVADHMLLAGRLGLDGVHLPDAARSVRAARRALGPDAIIGCFCGASRHDGMTAGEAGADYIGFGPVGASELGDGRTAPRELFRWWSELIELPVVAEGGLTPDLVAQLAPYADFFAIGPEIWGAADPLTALKTLVAPLG